MECPPVGRGARRGEVRGARGRERVGHQLCRSLQDGHLRAQFGDRGDGRRKRLDPLRQSRIELAILRLDERRDLLEEDDQRRRQARDIVAAEPSG